ncbi:MAG: hypothetical protein KAI73_05120 [Rhodospirillaceae bacterium]|nr:hypothetical protein [Rhodospirillaceae bacterium]
MIGLAHHAPVRCHSNEGFLMDVFGVKVQVFEPWPQVATGKMRTRQFPVHPVIKWLARWLPITPYIEAKYPEFVDGEPFMLNNKTVLVCSRRQLDALKREMEPKKDPRVHSGWGYPGLMHGSVV